MNTETAATAAYGHTAHLPGVSFEDARARVTAALKAEGFGVLTEIDVTATFKAKLDLDFRRYVILGACNPHLAHSALQADLGIGLLLPCNVAIWDADNAIVVSIARPEAMFALVKGDAMQPMVQDADQRLRRVLDHLRAGE